MDLIESINNKEVEYIVVEISSESAHFTNKESLSDERWMNSSEQDWVLRVESQNPCTGPQMYIHIAKKKYINTKDMQELWAPVVKRPNKIMDNNKVDKSKLTFAQLIAKRALNLESDIFLEEIDPKQQLFLESHSQLYKSAPCGACILKLTCGSVQYIV